MEMIKSNDCFSKINDRLLIHYIKNGSQIPNHTYPRVFIDESVLAHPSMEQTFASRGTEIGRMFAYNVRIRTIIQYTSEA